MPARDEIIKRVFAAQDKNGFWKLLPETDPHFPAHLHYSPTYRSTLWTLILLADLQLDSKDPDIRITCRLPPVAPRAEDPAHCP